MYEVFPTFLQNFSIRIDILKISKNGSIFLTPLEGRNKKKKTNENIARVAAVLKDDHHASYRMIAESMGYRKPSHTTFCLMIRKNEKCVHNLCHIRWQQNNGNSMLFTQKTWQSPVLSWFESDRLFCVSKVENGVEGGPICNYKLHSNICNDETENYSYYWFFESNTSIGKSCQPVYCS